MLEVNYSQTESETLKLRIGRCNVSGKFDERKLFHEIQQGFFDVCRLKVESEDEMASYRLQKMNVPFFFSGSIRRYETPTAKMAFHEPRHQDLEFIPYDGSQQKLLFDMLKGTWGAYPIGYYRTPYIGALLTKEDELLALFDFYRKQNDPTLNPDNGFMFIKHGDNYVGFFALNIVNGHLESHVGGILSAYRKDGYFLDKLAFIKDFCRRKRLSSFVFGARNENAEVQRIFQYVGFLPIGNENVFHITPLLTRNDSGLVSAPVAHWGSSANLHSIIFNKMIELVAGFGSLGNVIDFRINFSYLFKDADFLQMIYTFPVLSSTTIIVVARNSNKEVGHLYAFLEVKLI